MTPGSVQRRLASVLRVLALLVLLSGFLVNPWLGTLYRSQIINYRDVMLSYFTWAVAVSLVLLVSASFLRRVRSTALENATLLLLTCMLIALSDRLLLAKLGLPVWMANSATRYEHRPNAIRSWRNGKLIRINKYGLHDDDFTVKKAANELRGLLLGDSITMGYGVTYDETFSNQLERLLREKNSGHTSYQMINTGVQGYSTWQEYEVLLGSLRFEPDFIAIGFCMNDLTEPLIVDRELGGVGVDYHGIVQASSILTTYLFNETGYGRLAQELHARSKSLEYERLWEAYRVEDAAHSSVDTPGFAASWNSTLSNLDKIYAVAREEKLPIILLIFPFTFQLLDERLQNPQKILIDHARSRNVDVLDFTPIFRTLIFDDTRVEQLRSKGFSYSEIQATYEERTHRYFLDRNHYTVEGHRIVATQLYAYVANQSLTR